MPVNEAERIGSFGYQKWGPCRNRFPSQSAARFGRKIATLDEAEGYWRKGLEQAPGDPELGFSSSPQSGLTKEVWEKIFEVIGQYVGPEMTERRQRVSDLEKRDWVGVWEQGKAFGKSALCSHDGSCWIATREMPEGNAGAANSGWRLIVKRGRDGKDAK